MLDADTGASRVVVRAAGGMVLGEADWSAAHGYLLFTAGKNGAPVFWLSARGKPPASPFTGSVTLTDAQAAQLKAGGWYVNLHSKDHPAGELRGQIVPPA